MEPRETTPPTLALPKKIDPSRPFTPPPQPEVTAASPVEAALAGIHPDQLSPREALDALYQLKKLAGL